MSIRRVGTATVLTSSADGIARVWDLHSCGIVRDFVHEGAELASAEWSPIGPRLLTRTTSHLLHMWNASTSDILWSRQLTPGGIATFGFDQRTAIVHDESRCELVRLDVDSGSEVSLLKLDGMDSVSNCAVSRDARRIFAMSPNGRVGVWDSVTRQRVLAWDSTTHDCCGEFTDDGRFFLLTRRGCDPELWDLDQCERICSLRGYRERHPHSCPEFFVCAGGAMLGTYGPADSLEMWDAAAGSELAIAVDPVDLQLGYALCASSFPSVLGDLVLFGSPPCHVAVTIVNRDEADQTEIERRRNDWHGVGTRREAGPCD